MKAETAFNVIEALSEQEKARLLKMLEKQMKKRKVKKKKIWNETQLMERVIIHFQRKKKKNIKQ